MRGPQRDAGSALVGVQARDLLLFFRVPHTSFLRVGSAVGCHPQRSGRAATKSRRVFLPPTPFGESLCGLLR